MATEQWDDPNTPLRDVFEEEARASAMPAQGVSAEGTGGDTNQPAEGVSAEDIGEDTNKPAEGASGEDVGGDTTDRSQPGSGTGNTAGTGTAQVGSGTTKTAGTGTAQAGTGTAEPSSDVKALMGLFSGLNEELKKLNKTTADAADESSKKKKVDKPNMAVVLEQNGYYQC